MNRDDFIRLRHILDASHDALRFVEGKSRRDLDLDRMLVLAVVKCLEIIGEAAVKLDESTRREIPGIPWEQVIGMRNRLIHAYFDINLDRVWDTLTEDLPPMIEAVERAMNKSS